MKKKHNGTIDFMKFLFACEILAFHGSSMIGTQKTLFRSGAFGVEFFFIVSGFLMAMSAWKTLQQGNVLQIGTETARGIGKKIKNLFPYVLGAFLITLVLRETIKQTDPTKIPADLYKAVWEPLFLWISGIGKVTVNAPTWYISAMLVSMLILYPMLLKNFDLFTRVIAPALAIFLIGWIAKETGTLSVPATWLGLCYKGLIRGIAEMSLGCVCFVVCQWLMQLRLKTAGKILLSVIEWACYIIAIGICVHFGVDFGYLLVAVLAIGITISFSNQSATAALFHSPIFPFLGQFSLTIYLIHYPIRMVFMHIKPNLAYWPQMGLFFLITFVIGLLYLLIVKGILCLYHCNKNKVTF